MTIEQPEDKERRTFLKVSGFVAGAAFGGFFGDLGKDLKKAVYVVLKGLKAGVSDKSSIPRRIDLFLSDDPKKAAVLPPGTNRHRLAQGIFTPSRYVTKAFEIATATQKRMLGVAVERELSYDSGELALDGRRHLLILGGPVSTELTRALSGYHDVPAITEEKHVPIPKPNWSLPYYFYVGNENGYGYWGSEKRLGRRWLESDEERSLPIYGIVEGPSGNPVAPPMDGDRVAGDMLMITRVPNPNDIRGSIVIVGGLHGYSLEHFFSDLESNLNLFQEIMNPEKHDFFQAMVPYSIGSDRTITPNWRGIGEWRPRLSKVDIAAFLSHFSVKNG